MAIMNDCLFSTDKLNSAVYGFPVTSDNDGGQFSNINLNQNIKCPLSILVQSCSKTNKDEHYATFKILDSKISENNKAKETLKACYKSLDLCSNKNGDIEKASEKQWKKDKSSVNDSQSTLSLHIAAFENSIEDDVSVAIKGENKKEVINASSFFTQNPFEFPRQQNDKVAEPEMSKFRASQRLINPNEAFQTFKMNNENDEALGDLATMIEEPLDFVRMALNEHVMVKMRNDRQLSGILQSFDQHLNMILSEVVETITTTESDPDSAEEILHSTTREIPMLFLRGDSVILVSTPNRNPN